MVDPTEKILAWYASQGITVTLAPDCPGQYAPTLE